jgi:hypothetical protein
MYCAWKKEECNYKTCRHYQVNHIAKDVLECAFCGKQWLKNHVGQFIHLEKKLGVE